VSWMLKRERRGGCVASVIRRCSGFSAAVPAELLGRAMREGLELLRRRVSRTPELQQRWWTSWNISYVIDSSTTAITEGTPGGCFTVEGQ